MKASDLNFIILLNILSHFRWVYSSSGKELTFKIWGNNEPDNGNGHGEHCATLYSDNPRWVDLYCTREFHFMCEKAATIINK